ncbi:Imm52 family immunity protein [Mesorhizobium calcicola]|uniref:Imm52 family immunity protein n=1 Tax=Mesorhizobium calcicola TaxID=1300310 RepID=A0ABW4WJV2_9HYPH
MSINIYVYWGPRNETIDDLVLRTQSHFRTLSDSDERLSRWAPLGRSLKKAVASEKVDISSAEVLRSWLLKGQNKTDVVPRQPIPELGYHLSFWNQRLGNLEASTSIYCGAFSEYLSSDSQNNASLELNYLEEVGIKSDLLINIFCNLLEIWNPIWGAVWKYAPNGHPNGIPSDTSKIQLAFYQQIADLGPKNRLIGREQHVGSGGSVWINNQVAHLLERN